jgi:hypothetical protein
MDIGLLRGRFTAHHDSSVLPVRNHGFERSELSVTKPLSAGTRRKLWVLLGLDIVTVPWMLTFGSWFDETSKLSSVLTLGGHHRLVIVMAVVGSAMLAGLAVSTDWFAETGILHRALILVATVMSLVALAGVLSVVVLSAGIVLILWLLIKH